jgi:hypothetical protein
MVPRTVQMSKVISSVIGPYYESQLGNILGPQGFGWSNLNAQWFLNGPTTLGNPAIFSYVIHHYDPDGTPYYSQPPVRRHLSLGSCLHPVADNPVPPPLSDLSLGMYGG